MKNFNDQLPDLGYLNLGRAGGVFYQLTPAQLIEEALKRDEGVLSECGALAVDTGEFTGRSPKDRFIVDDHVTHDAVWWSDINIPFDEQQFDLLFNKITAYLNERDIFVRDCSVCANEKYHTDLRVITENAFQSLFAHHLFIRPEVSYPELAPEWTIISAPGFKADPALDGTRQGNFSMICFSRKLILIGGTAYTGEIKKAVFSILNFVLPHERNVLPMHCAANVGAKGDTAVFFGLSGTGKTTLSADPDRSLIGDDEHGWSDYTVFNFEGGCYAKCANLTEEHEPQIYQAIKFGTLLENVSFYPGTCMPDYADLCKTENNRAAYPLHYIKNIVSPSIGTAPKNIFFLTADAFGILPPVSKLTPVQAMYHFISGYTAKVAGTEKGIVEPEATFSACFGKAFLPLHPVAYANLLGRKIREHRVNVWLINTGWTGGSYHTGKRIRLKYTRAMITAALTGALDNVTYQMHPIFKLMMPVCCPGVPESLLNPRNTWANCELYDERAHELAISFARNFEQYASVSNAEIMEAGPDITISA
jgi:phosphoenolpyruvate carboxykinase (ATP)